MVLALGPETFPPPTHKTKTNKGLIKIHPTSQSRQSALQRDTHGVEAARLSRGQQ